MVRKGKTLSPPLPTKPAKPPTNPQENLQPNPLTHLNPKENPSYPGTMGPGNGHPGGLTRQQWPEWPST